MDLFCANCGEPWDIHHVLHDEPDQFEREGVIIYHCPCCPQNDKKEPGSEERKKVMREIGSLFADDIDSFACFLEDHQDDLDEIFGNLPDNDEEE